MKNKDIIIIILLIVLLLVVGGFIVYISISNNQKLEEMNKVPDKVEQNVGNQKEAEKKDPYSNYKDVKWATTKEKHIEIKNGKVYVEVLNNEEKMVKEQAKGIEGTPIKVASYIWGGMLHHVVLTKEGKVYSLTDWSSQAYQIERLNNYYIIDMSTEIKDVVMEPAYFLSAEGKLINNYGYTYEELNKDFTASSSMNMEIGQIFLDKNDHIYYSDYDYETEKPKYKAIVNNKNEKVVKAEVIHQWPTINNDTDTDIKDRYIILTEEDELIFFDGSIKQESKKVKDWTMRIEKNKENNEEYSVYIFTMEDETKITIKDGNFVSFQKW